MDFCRKRLVVLAEDLRQLRLNCLRVMKTRWTAVSSFDVHSIRIELINIVLNSPEMKNFVSSKTELKSFSGINLMWIRFSYIHLKN